MSLSWKRRRKQDRDKNRKEARDINEVNNEDADEDVDKDVNEDVDEDVHEDFNEDVNKDFDKDAIAEANEDVDKWYQKLSPLPADPLHRHLPQNIFPNIWSPPPRRQQHAWLLKATDWCPILIQTYAHPHRCDHLRSLDSTDQYVIFVALARAIYVHTSDL